MVCVVESEFDRKTGNLVNQKVVEEISMSDEEYVKPLAQIEAKYFMKKFSEGKYKEG